MTRSNKISETPILILHGWGTRLSGKTFIPLQTALRKKGYRVFVPDLPGFGKNIPIDHPYTLDDYISFVKNYMTDKKISQAIVIGHSFGGRIGIKYAYMNPKSIRTLILTGTPGFRSGNNVKYYLSLLLAKTGKIVVQILPFGFIYYFMRNVFYRIIGTKDYTNANHVMRDTFRAIISDKPSKYMPLLTVPVLMIWGENDVIVPLSVAERMKNVIPGSRLVRIANQTHALPYEDAEEFARVVDEFVRQE